MRQPGEGFQFHVGFALELYDRYLSGLAGDGESALSVPRLRQSYRWHGEKRRERRPLSPGSFLHDSSPTVEAAHPACHIVLTGAEIFKGRS